MRKKEEEEEGGRRRKNDQEGGRMRKMGFLLEPSRTFSNVLALSRTVSIARPLFHMFSLRKYSF